MAWHRQNQTSQCLATIPGIGPIGGVSFALRVPDPKAFRSARHVAAWVGITPRENSTGGKQRPSTRILRVALAKETKKCPANHETDNL